MNKPVSLYNIQVVCEQEDSHLSWMGEESSHPLSLSLGQRIRCYSFCVSSWRFRPLRHFYLRRFLLCYYDCCRVVLFFHMSYSSSWFLWQEEFEFWCSDDSLTEWYFFQSFIHYSWLWLHCLTCLLSLCVSLVVILDSIFDSTSILCVLQLSSLPFLASCIFWIPGISQLLFLGAEHENICVKEHRQHIWIFSYIFCIFNRRFRLTFGFRLRRYQVSNTCVLIL